MFKILSLFILPLVIFANSEEKIKDIQLNNLYHISQSTAINVIGAEVGQPLDKEKLSKSLKKFYRQGYFTDIKASFENGILVIDFSEKPSISKATITGYKNKDEEIDTLLKSIGLKKGDLFDNKRLNRAKEKLKKEIEAEGYIDTLVESVITPKDGSIDIELIVRKGEKIIIKKLTYCGLKSVKQEEIEELTANKAEESFSWFIGREDGKLSLQELEYDSARIKDVYMRKGYLDAKVEAPLLSVDFNNYSANLSYSITEGKPYVVNKISLDIDGEFEKKDEVSESLMIKVDTTFNIENLRKDMNKIKSKIANEGYAFVQVMPDFQKNQKDNTVHIIYKVSLGKKVYINDIIIAGNTSTLDRIIRREIFLAPEDLYSLKELNESRAALGRTGHFESTRIEEERVSEDKVNLIVTVKEAPTGNVMVGGGYGSYGGVMVNAAISDRNIFGSGVNVGFNVDHSDINTKFNVSLSNQRIKDSLYTGSINLYNSEYIYPYGTTTIAQKTLGGAISFGKHYTRHLRGNLSYKYNDIEYGTGDYDQDGNVILSNSTKYTVSAITPSVLYNNTDDYYLPRSGIDASSSLEIAGLGGSASYVKSFTNLSLYKGVREYIDYDLIFRYKAKLKLVHDTGYVPTYDTLYMGGVSSVRGFEPYSISPNSKLSDGVTSAYGVDMFTKSFSHSLEANIPFVESAKMRLTGFIDHGMIGKDNINQISRYSAGIALEWISPVGPIQLIFGNALNAEDYERTSTFEFSMGQRF